MTPALPAVRKPRTHPAPGDRWTSATGAVLVVTEVSATEVVAMLGETRVVVPLTQWVWTVETCVWAGGAE